MAGRGTRRNTRESRTDRIDRFQRSHRAAALPVAVLYKFADDQGNYLAALIAFYAFLSLVPLLLLSSTILGFALHGHRALQQSLLNSALGQYPVVGHQLADPHGISASGAGLAVGIIGALYGGLGVAQAVQNAMNTMWRVPRNSRPNPIRSRMRSLLLLAVMGTSVIATTGLAALGSVLGVFGVAAKVGIGAGTFLINQVVFTVAFRLATARDVSVRDTLPGASVCAALWLGMQYVGSLYIAHVVRHASEINSVFAVVLGLIVWLYLQALIVVLAVEYNSVRALRLYPRALLTPFTDNVDLTAADRDSYAQQARAARAKGFEKIGVRFDERRRRSGDG